MIGSINVCACCRLVLLFVCWAWCIVVLPSNWRRNCKFPSAPDTRLTTCVQLSLKSWLLEFHIIFIITNLAICCGYILCKFRRSKLVERCIRWNTCELIEWREVHFLKLKRIKIYVKFETFSTNRRLVQQYTFAGKKLPLSQHPAHYDMNLCLVILHLVRPLRT